MTQQEALVTFCVTQELDHSFDMHIKKPVACFSCLVASVTTCAIAGSGILAPLQIFLD